jgi:protein transport protein SEC31
MADYILAVGSNNGSTAVYDLRGKREIMKLSYPGGRKQVTGLAWHPNLVRAYIEDNAGCLNSSKYTTTAHSYCYRE